MADPLDLKLIPERLSLDEVAARFPGQWVVLVDLDDVGGDTTGGRVVAAAAQRSALGQTVRQLARRRFLEVAVLWTGGAPQFAAA